MRFWQSEKRKFKKQENHSQEIRSVPEKENTWGQQSGYFVLGMGKYFFKTLGAVPSIFENGATREFLWNALVVTAQDLSLQDMVGDALRAYIREYVDNPALNLVLTVGQVAIITYLFHHTDSPEKTDAPVSFSQQFRPLIPFFAIRLVDKGLPLVDARVPSVLTIPLKTMLSIYHFRCNTLSILRQSFLLQTGSFLLNQKADTKALENVKNGLLNPVVFKLTDVFLLFIPNTFLRLLLQISHTGRYILDTAVPMVHSVKDIQIYFREHAELLWFMGLTHALLCRWLGGYLRVYTGESTVLDNTISSIVIFFLTSLLVHMPPPPPTENSNRWSLDPLTYLERATNSVVTHVYEMLNRPGPSMDWQALKNQLAEYISKRPVLTKLVRNLPYIEKAFLDERLQNLNLFCNDYLVRKYWYDLCWRLQAVLNVIEEKRDSFLVDVAKSFPLFSTYVLSNYFHIDKRIIGWAITGLGKEWLLNMLSQLNRELKKTPKHRNFAQPTPPNLGEIVDTKPIPVAVPENAKDSTSVTEVAARVQNLHKRKESIVLEKKESKNSGESTTDHTAKMQKLLLNQSRYLKNHGQWSNSEPSSAQNTAFLSKNAL